MRRSGLLLDCTADNLFSPGRACHRCLEIPRPRVGCPGLPELSHRSPPSREELVAPPRAESRALRRFGQHAARKHGHAVADTTAPPRTRAGHVPPQYICALHELPRPGVGSATRRTSGRLLMTSLGAGPPTLDPSATALSRAATRSLPWATEIFPVETRDCPARSGSRAHFDSVNSAAPRRATNRSQNGPMFVNGPRTEVSLCQRRSALALHPDPAPHTPWRTPAMLSSL